MARGLTDYLIEKLLNHTFGSTAYTRPTSLTMHLYRSDPQSGGVEVNGSIDGNYSAQTITFGAEGAITNNRVYNNALVSFAYVMNTTTTYTVSHYAIKDSSLNILASADFPSTVTRISGTNLEFAAGSVYAELLRT